MPRSAAAVGDKRPSRANGATPVIGRGEIVLVVEDDASVRQVTVSTLNSLGFSVKEAESASEAAAMLDGDNQVDLVLSDVKMPGMSGIELARIVQERWPGIAILLTSGYVDAHEEVDDFHFIQKPFRSSDLAEKLQSILTSDGASERLREAAQ